MSQYYNYYDPTDYGYQLAVRRDEVRKEIADNGTDNWAAIIDRELQTVARMHPYQSDPDQPLTDWDAVAVLYVMTTLARYGFGFAGADVEASAGLTARHNCLTSAVHLAVVRNWLTDGENLHRVGIIDKTILNYLENLNNSTK